MLGGLCRWSRVQESVRDRRCYEPDSDDGADRPRGHRVSRPPEASRSARRGGRGQSWLMLPPTARLTCAQSAGGVSAVKPPSAPFRSLLDCSSVVYVSMRDQGKLYARVRVKSGEHQNGITASTQVSAVTRVNSGEPRTSPANDHFTCGNCPTSADPELSDFRLADLRWHYRANGLSAEPVPRYPLCRGQLGPVPIR